MSHGRARGGAVRAAPTATPAVVASTVASLVVASSPVATPAVASSPVATGALSLWLWLRLRLWLAPALALALGAVPVGSAAAQPAVFADSLPQPLPGTQPGDATRGRALATSRSEGLCLLCHHWADAGDARSQGDLASDLTGAGQRWSIGQLRLRLVDSQQWVPGSLMPSYHRMPTAARVGARWREQPIFTAQQIEDVVAYLRTL